MKLLCGVCLYTGPEGAPARPAVTVFAGFAACEAHLYAFPEKGMLDVLRRLDTYVHREGSQR